MSIGFLVFFSEIKTSIHRFRQTCDASRYNQKHLALLQPIEERCFRWNFDISMLHFNMFLQAIIPAICHRALCACIRFQSGVGDHMFSGRFPREKCPIALITLQKHKTNQNTMIYSNPMHLPYLSLVFHVYFVYAYAYSMRC